MRVKIPSLLLITDSRRYADEHLFAVLEEALSNGLDAVLLREKELSSAKLLALASKLREITAHFGAQLYIHSQADIAAAVNADGVHLASGDITNIQAVRGWLNDAGKTVSVSCHNRQELELAGRCGADFVFLSPVFATASHPGAPTIDLKGFRSLAARTKLPVMALGGINCDNCKHLEGSRLAVIDGILAAEDAGMAARVLSAAVPKP